MRILFVTATRIGDAVLSTGVLSHLLERYPGARLTIAAGRDAAPLFADVPGLERVITIEKQRWRAHWLGLYRAVALRRWDVVVDLRASALAYLLWGRQRYVARKRRIGEHRVKQMADIFGLDAPPSPHLWIAPAREAEAARLMSPPFVGAGSGAPVLAIGPAANWRGKEWRAERFAELAQRLTAPGGLFPGARVAVLAAKHEWPQAAPMIEALGPRALDLVGKVHLLTAAAVIKRSALFIANDTGLMHLAAATGTPTLGLFGPSPIDQYAPWGSHTAVVATAIPHKDLFPPDFDHLTTDTLMDSLSVDMAEEAARQLWARVAGKAA
ncbi:MAG TPA: glycosyltransferase family 9 protein [Stellaceae bacterium]|jgi:heptosyltransferase III|nr:glycosyltransferase family 9 protein [Stellaceae bacterium]